MATLNDKIKMEMTKEYYIILGWILGILSMLVRELIQERKERHKKEIDIISENLKFIFNTGNLYNNFRTDKVVFEQMREAFPEKSSELERKMYENFDKNLKEDFFPELMFHSFQLKRLKDKSFWKDFEVIINNFEELGKGIMAQEKEEVISNQNSKINDLKKKYVEKCHEKTKI